MGDYISQSQDLLQMLKVERPVCFGNALLPDNLSPSKGQARRIVRHVEQKEFNFRTLETLLERKYDPSSVRNASNRRLTPYFSARLWNGKSWGLDVSQLRNASELYQEGTAEGDRQDVHFRTESLPHDLLILVVSTKQKLVHGKSRRLRKIPRRRSRQEQVTWNTVVRAPRTILAAPTEESHAKAANDGTCRCDRTVTSPGLAQEILGQAGLQC